jgi:HEAT repeat protein
MAALGVVGNAEALEVLLRGLHDPSDVVRLEAGLALVRVGGADETEQVFEFAVSQNGLIRILVMEALRWRAQFLCNGVLRRYLRSGETETVIVCLETIEAWRVALDLPEMGELLCHPSPLVRERAYRALPYVTSSERFVPEILAGMADPNERVRTAAVFVAGRLKVMPALPLLVQGLNAADARLSLTAAYSLAEIGNSGIEVLEGAVMSGKPHGATALEALERLRTGRFEHANL